MLTVSVFVFRGVLRKLVTVVCKNTQIISKHIQETRVHDVQDIFFGNSQLLILYETRLRPR